MTHPSCKYSGKSVSFVILQGNCLSLQPKIRLNHLAIMYNYNQKKKRKKKKRVQLKIGHGRNKPITAKQKAQYYKYLQSSQWKAKRDVAMEMYGRACGLCGSRHDLQVHHRTYKNIFKELMEDLMILCESCHYAHHKAQIWNNGKTSKYMKDPAYDKIATTFYPDRRK